MPKPARPAPTPAWTVLSLRPHGQHADLSMAAARAGGRLLALSPQRIVAHDDADTRTALRAALAAEIVVFTSPNAVRAATSLQPLHARDGQALLAVGDGTRRVLARRGMPAQAPLRMDSEGLLEFPVLQQVAGLRVGLVTGAGGRDLLAPALQARGARVLRATVYARVERHIPAARWQAVRTLLAGRRPCWLALSSAEALRTCLAQCPVALHPRLLEVPVIAASPRLASIAREAGFTRIHAATSARPASLVDAARKAFG